MVRDSIPQFTNAVQPCAERASKKRLGSALEYGSQVPAPQMGLVLWREETHPEPETEVGDDIGRARWLACDCELRLRALDVLTLLVA
jgi:hypothetical protein